MDEKIKMIVIMAGAMVGSFVFFFLIFWLVLPKAGPEAGSEAAAESGTTAEMAGEVTGIQTSTVDRRRRVPGGLQLSAANVLGVNIPAEAKVEGYGWAKWGMNVDTVLARLREEGVEQLVSYRPENSDFASVVDLNPDEYHFKIEYRFYNDRLFHVEVYYSDYYKSNSFNQFLLEKMTEYGRPYEQYATVDELGKVILHAKWDTEDSLIELVGRPEGRFSLFIDSWMTLIQLEEARKTEERLAY